MGALDGAPRLGWGDGLKARTNFLPRSGMTDRTGNLVRTGTKAATDGTKQRHSDRASVRGLQATHALDVSPVRLERLR